jgi:hypothetical protein
MGLADLTPAVPNTLTAFAAKAGSVSFDGDGPNTPFVSALVKYIAQPGLDIRLALGKVHDEVLRATGNREEPRIYGTLDSEEVALVPAIPEAGVASAEATPAARLDEDLDYRIARRIGSVEGWRSFLAVHGTGFHAQAARAEIDKLLLAAKAPAPTTEEASNGDASSIATAPDEPAPPSAPSPRMEAATAPAPSAVGGDQRHATIVARVRGRTPTPTRQCRLPHQRGHRQAINALLRAQSAVLRARHSLLIQPPTATMIAITAMRRIPSSTVYSMSAAPSSSFLNRFRIGFSLLNMLSSLRITGFLSLVCL